jgi:hypothetical protein
VTFESASQLGEIQAGTFADCAALESICVPTSVTHLGQFSFRNCIKLTMITFPADSKLKSIDYRAFSRCIRLKSLVMPPSVEKIMGECFDECWVLSSLTFSSPSHRVNLWHLPATLPDVTVIPDSVRSLAFDVGVKLGRGYTLTFGLGSQIEDVRVRTARPSCRRESFLLFPSGRLKYFRCRLEFRK